MASGTPTGGFSPGNPQTERDALRLLILVLIMLGLGAGAIAALNVLA